MAGAAPPRHDRTMATKTSPNSTGPDPTDTDQTDTDDTDTDNPPVTPPPASSKPSRNNRFFGWMRSLGIARQPGWIGGVCSGIAARLDIDPLIVRGIVIVIAILGGPAFIIYAAAWLLLPDEDDTIHLENLGRGKIESPIAGIGALVLLSMLPMAQGFWYVGSSYWGDPSWGYDLGRALWTIVLLAVVVAFVVWIARRAGRNDRPSDSGPVFSPATTDGNPDTIPEPTIPGASDPGTASLPQPPPASPAADASIEELAAWRESRELWKQQNRQFKNAEAASQREVRRQRAAEQRERARLASTESAERRGIRRRENPVLSAPIVVAVLGAAVVAGGLAAAAGSLGAATSGIAAAIGFAVAALVMGIAIVVGGVLRHRSGFLAFLAGVTLLLALVMTAVPTGRMLVPPTLYGGGVDVGVGNFVQPVGTASVAVYPGMPEGVTDIWQGSGSISISIDEGTAAIVEVTSPASVVTVWARPATGLVPGGINPESTLANGVRRWAFTVGDPEATEIRTVRIWQTSGYVEITDKSMQEVKD